MVSVAVDDLNSASTESIWCKIMVDEMKYLYVGVCYKSPSAEQAEIDELIVIKRASNNQVLIIGDFNYPAINEKNLEAKTIKKGNLWSWYMIAFWSNVSWLQQVGIMF